MNKPGGSRVGGLWPGACRGGTAGDLLGDGRQGERGRKKKSFNLAFPHPQPQIHSSCQMQSPLALTLTHC